MKKSLQVCLKPLKGFLAQVTSPGYLILLNLLFFPEPSFEDPFHFFSGMRVPVCIPEDSPAKLSQGLVVGFLSSASVAEKDKGVPSAVSYVCSPGRCDHSSQLYLDSVGSCFLLMQSNKNIIIMKVRLNDSLK